MSNKLYTTNKILAFSGFIFIVLAVSLKSYFTIFMILAFITLGGSLVVNSYLNDFKKANKLKERRFLGYVAFFIGIGALIYKIIF